MAGVVFEFIVEWLEELGVRRKVEIKTKQK